jgi:hypothetical protein
MSGPLEYSVPGLRLHFAILVHRSAAHNRLDDLTLHQFTLIRGPLVLIEQLLWPDLPFLLYVDEDKVSVAPWQDGPFLRVQAEGTRGIRGGEGGQELDRQATLVHPFRQQDREYFLNRLCEIGTEP